LAFFTLPTSIAHLPCNGGQPPVPDNPCLVGLGCSPEAHGSLGGLRWSKSPFRAKRPRIERVDDVDVSLRASPASHHKGDSDSSRRCLPTVWQCATKRTWPGLCGKRGSAISEAANLVRSGSRGALPSAPNLLHNQMIGSSLTRIQRWRRRANMARLLVQISRPLRPPNNQPSLTQVPQGHAHRVHKVVVLALRERRALRDHHVGP